MVLAQWIERGLGQKLAPDDKYEAQPDVMDTRSSFWQLVAPDPNFVSNRDKPPARAFPPASTKTTTTTTTKTPTTICIHCNLPTPVISANDDEDTTNNDTTTAPTTTITSTPTPNMTEITEEIATPTGSATTIFLSPTPAKQASRRKPSKQSQSFGVDGSGNNNNVNNKKNDNGTPSQPPLLEVEEQILMASRDTFFMTQRNAKFRDHAGKLLKLCSSTSALKDKALAQMEKLLQISADRLQATDGDEANLLTQARSLQMGLSCPDGLTPLLATSMAGRTEAAKLLLKYANEDDQVLMLAQTNLFGQTPQHLAAANGQLDMVELLQSAAATSPPPPPSSLLSKSAATLEQSSPATDVTGLSAWDTAMTSPHPSARKHRQRLDEMLQSPTPLKGGGGGGSRDSIKSSSSRVYAAPASLRLQYTMAHLDGRRVFNEDAVLCRSLYFDKYSERANNLIGGGSSSNDAMLFLICDGHDDCGSVAHFVTQHLPDALVQAADHGTDDADADADVDIDVTAFWTQTCQAAAHAVDAALKKAHLSGGCTACWVIVTASKIICANVGDSRCLLVSSTSSSDTIGDQVQPLSWDHKPDLPGEKARIEAAGLTVMHEIYKDKEGNETSIAKVKLSALDQLGTSRAFGDFEYKKLKEQVGDDGEGNSSMDRLPAVICTPDVTIVERCDESHACLILACDGIWDVQSNEAVANFVLTARQNNHGRLSGNTGPALLQKCLHSGDNLSLVLVSFTAPDTACLASSSTSSLLTPALARLTLDDKKDNSNNDDDDDDDTMPKTLLFSPGKQV